ncbi:MAG: hypothetical protein GTO60_03985, partial [Gammaproteobacteria bacterium]|nr:hypothetical protein [Gammaproteobacteria bacterium]NIO61826.1 hypothetical protein [Gammaproteobacteria bacterium]
QVTVTGTAETRANIYITGGAVSLVQGTCDQTGSFSLEVPLKANQLNQLCVKARDASNNESLPTCISIYQERSEFIVTDAQLETTANQIAVNFSRAIDAATLTAENFTVSSAAGILGGTLTPSSNNTAAT